MGLAEQQIVRYLLDTCATVDEAKEALLMAKQYYFFVPCHFVVADRSGRSFVWEHSAGHNREAIVEADRFTGGRTVCTNHLLHTRHDLTDLPAEDGALGTAALTYTRWRSLHAATSTGAVVDRDDIREQFRTRPVRRTRSKAPERSGMPSTTWRIARWRSASTSTTSATRASTARRTDVSLR